MKRQLLDVLHTGLTVIYVAGRPGGAPIPATETRGRRDEEVCNVMRRRS